MLIAAVDRRWSDGAEIIDTLPSPNIFHYEERSICAEYPVSLSFDPPIVHSPPPNRAVRSNHAGSTLYLRCFPT